MSKAIRSNIAYKWNYLNLWIKQRKSIKMAFFYSFSIFLFFILFPVITNAQFKKEKFVNPIVMLKYENTLPGQLIDTIGSYASDEAIFNMKIPLISGMKKGGKTGSFGFWALVLNTGGSCNWLKFSYLSARQQLINLHGGLSAVYYPGRKSVFLINASSGISEDNYSLFKPIIKYNGTAMLVHKVSDHFSYTIGAAYSYLYGSGLPLPVFGARLSPGRKSIFNFLFPFNISYSYHFGKENKFVFFIKPAGNRYHVSNRGHFNDNVDLFFFRQRLFRLGANTSFALSPLIKIGPEVGVCSKRRLSYSESAVGEDPFFNMKSKAGFYFALNLTLHFGSKKHYGANDAVNYLLDNGIDNLPDIGD